MEKRFKIEIYARARVDVIGIVDYWENTLGTSSTPFLDDYEKALLKISASPFSHHIPKDETLKAEGYRIIPIRNYYMFYKVVDDTVQIHRVLYSKMDFSKLF